MFKGRKLSASGPFRHSCQILSSSDYLSVHFTLIAVASCRQFAAAGMAGAVIVKGYFAAVAHRPAFFGRLTQKVARKGQGRTTPPGRVPDTP
jgi:hypothetical protein